MRPTRLELAGFGSFREPTVLDLKDVELFALAGPTGAGKSTLVDAIVFALYGSLPRLDDTRRVAEVIANGRNQARVRLDFTVQGQPCTAVRVVERTKSGGTTKEARLEQGGNTLADNAKDMTAAVTALLRLDFDQFTRVVVLPQGRFAEFMHAKPSDRNELLVNVLGLQVYEEVRSQAKVAEQKAGQQVDLFTRELNQLPDASPERIDRLRGRVAALEALQDRCAEVGPKLDTLRDRVMQARSTLARAEEHLELLDGLGVPEGLKDLAGRIDEATAGRQRADDALKEAMAAVEQAEGRRDQLPQPSVLEQQVEQRRRLADLEQARTTMAADAEAAEAAAADADVAAASAEEALAQARAAQESARVAHAAADLAQHLSAGDDCPVCRQRVDVVPDLELPADLDACRRAVEQATERVDAARKAATAAHRGQAAATSALQGHDAQVEQLRAALAEVPALGALLATLQEAREAAAAVAAATQRRRDAARAADEAVARLDAIDADRQAARVELMQARDRVAALQPPAVDPDDLAGSWRSLSEWAPSRRDDVKRDLDAARAEMEAATQEGVALKDGLVEAARAAGVDAQQAADVTAAVGAALGEARVQLATLQGAAERAVELQAAIGAQGESQQVAGELARLLQANHFETWLIARALQGLVIGATRILRDLSGGAYSLEVDERNNFVVVDHLNADERRSARTLSGGETFLASLALALALADRVADLSVDGGARLEALFLDEGFGTLDPNTLDVVASAIEELGASRMVGIVTHVADLAERVPVRFEVRKESVTSLITRVDT